MENLYDILEVSQKASKEVIERAYKVLNKYDWYCYLINDSLDVHEVVKHIKEKE